MPKLFMQTRKARHEKSVQMKAYWKRRRAAEKKENGQHAVPRVAAIEVAQPRTAKKRNGHDTPSITLAVKINSFGQLDAITKIANDVQIIGQSV